VADQSSLASPVRLVPGDADRPPQEGIALCLSGGGYRAMLFHVGALIRLNELAYLPKLARISSVSGGSITAGMLGLKWNRPDPHTDWPRHALRVNDLIDNQVRDLRKRQLIGSFVDGDHAGTYWSIRSNLPKSYPAPGVLPCPFEATQHLAAVPTRLAALEAELQEQVINWGYAICDAAMRLHVETNAAAPIAFPFPAVGVGTPV